MGIDGREPTAGRQPFRGRIAAAAAASLGGAEPGPSLSIMVLQRACDGAHRADRGQNILCVVCKMVRRGSDSLYILARPHRWLTDWVYR